MGIIASLLFSAGYMKTFHIPLWIVLSAHAAIALGTLSGGWRIVKTMGQRITKLRPIDGFCAETASAMSIFLATHLGVPVSTTHVITGAISGVGATKRLSAVRWGVTLKIVWAWIFTIPGTGLIGGACYLLLQLFFMKRNDFMKLCAAGACGCCAPGFLAPLSAQTQGGRAQPSPVPAESEALKRQLDFARERFANLITIMGEQP